MITTLRNLFVPSAIASTLETLPVLQTTVMDTFFKERDNHYSTMIGRSILEKKVQTVPVVRRDGNAYPLAGDNIEIDFVAPLPIKPSITISAAEINDMKAWLGDKHSLENWRKNKIDELRRAIRDTTEGMCSTVLSTGKVEWPQYNEGGGTNFYTIDFGAVPTFDLAKELTASSTLSEVYNLLSDMEQVIRRNGFGGTVEFWAGRKVFSLLIDMAATSTTTLATNPYKITFKDNKIEVGSYIVHTLNEYYPSPLNGEWVAKLAEKEIQAVAVQHTGRVTYLAIDHLDVMAPTPFHITPIQKTDGSSIELIAQSKPLPARASKSSCKCAAVA